MKNRGPWKILSSKVVYKNPWIRVVEDKVIQPRGEKGIFGVVHYREGVGVLVLDDKKNVYLVKEFHYAIGEEMLSAVLGGMDGNESKLVAAKRELKEELGITAKSWTSLGLHHPITMNGTVPMHLFLARNISIGKQKEDSTEIIERVKMPFSKALQLVLNGKLTQGSTQVLILKANEFLRKGKR